MTQAIRYNTYAVDSYSNDEIIATTPTAIPINAKVSSNHDGLIVYATQKIELVTIYTFAGIDFMCVPLEWDIVSDPPNGKCWSYFMTDHEFSHMTLSIMLSIISRSMLNLPVPDNMSSNDGFWQNLQPLIHHRDINNWLLLKSGVAYV